MKEADQRQNLSHTNRHTFLVKWGHSTPISSWYLILTSLLILLAWFSSLEAPCLPAFYQVSCYFIPQPWLLSLPSLVFFAICFHFFLLHSFFLIFPFPKSLFSNFVSLFSFINNPDVSIESCALSKKRLDELSNGVANFSDLFIHFCGPDFHCCLNMHILVSHSSYCSQRVIFWNFGCLTQIFHYYFIELQWER